MMSTNDNFFSNWSVEDGQDQPSPLEQVLAFFQEDGWSAYPLDHAPMVSTTAEGEHGVYPFHVVWDAQQSYLICHAICTLEIPESRRPAMAEFVARANDGLVAGNFDFDFDRGEVRFRNSLSISSTALTAPVLHKLFYTSVQTLDGYVPGIEAVIDGSTPADAINYVEDMLI